MTTSRTSSAAGTAATKGSKSNSNNRHHNSWMCSYKIVIPIFISRCFLDLVLCPHSKVEESFNLQASHDLMYYGLSPALTQSVFPLNNGSDDGNNNILLPYDHLQYPGGTLTVPIFNQ